MNSDSPSARGRYVMPVVLLLVAMASIQLGASFAKTLFHSVGAPGAVALRTALATFMLVLVLRPWRVKAERGSRATLVVYGAMSGEANLVNPGLMVFQDIVLRGFWLTRYLASAPRPDILRLNTDLEGLVECDQLAGAVDSVFAAEDVKAAVARAGEAGGNGKVFVRFRPE